MWPHILCGRRPLCHRFMLSLAVVGSTHTMHAATIDVIGSAYSHPLWPHILCGRRPLCHRFMLSLSVIGSTQTTHAETISFLFAVRGCSSIQMLCATPVTRRLLRTSAVCASRVVHLCDIGESPNGWGPWSSRNDLLVWQRCHRPSPGMSCLRRHIPHRPPDAQGSISQLHDFRAIIFLLRLSARLVLLQNLFTLVT